MISSPKSFRTGTVRREPASGRSFQWLFVMVPLLLWSGCSLHRPLHEQRIGDLGRFEFHEPQRQMSGVIVGAPHGFAEADSADYAQWISQRTGAGLVIAYGFGAKRLSVSQPLVRSGSYGFKGMDPAQRRSVFPEFKKLLLATAGGKITFYVGICCGSAQSEARRIEAASSGFTFEELKILKDAFLRIRDRALDDTGAPKVAIALDPLDRLSWRSTGVRHHGTLMMAQRGLNLRLPKALSDPGVKAIYREVLASWIGAANKIARENSINVPRMQIQVLEHGRLEWIPSRSSRKGIVLGAPHGSFDQFTAEAVTQISFQTNLPAVIAKGFTPTEGGGGWRINVNRPTERRYPAGELEVGSERANRVYQEYKRAVLDAAGGSLDLYIDIHQNGQQRDIEVASVGVTKEEAALVKSFYREARDRVLGHAGDAKNLEMRIEPLDEIEIGAWAAKAQGMLGVAKKSLHFELPVHRALDTAKARDAYTRILAMLLNRLTDCLADTGTKRHDAEDLRFQHCPGGLAASGR